MSSLFKRPLAFADLAEIWSFIADDSEANADRFLATFDDKLKLLATQPYMGRSREELMAQLRSFPIGHYLVFFLPHADGGIDVVRVLHGARDITVADFMSDGNA